MSVASISPPCGLGASPSLLPLSRKSDEDLISLLRERDVRAFDELVVRYRGELLRLCRRMMGSSEDAEDVLQEVFAAAYVAILADERPIDCGPWLHRIARNRCLNKLRRRDSSEPLILDDEKLNGHAHYYVVDGGTTSADKAHLKSELDTVVQDVLRLPQGQRGALVRQVLGGDSYDQIATDMELSVASVRSLLQRARVALGEAAEAREISCAEVRSELEEKLGVHRRASTPVRRHVKVCPSCARFGKNLRHRRRSLYALFPFGPGTAASIGSASGTSVGLGSAAGGISAGVGALAAKAAAGLAVLALAGAGAAVIDHSGTRHSSTPPASPPASDRGIPGSDPVAGHNGRSAFQVGLAGAASPSPKSAGARHGSGGSHQQALAGAGGGHAVTRSTIAPSSTASDGSTSSAPVTTQRTRPVPGSTQTTVRTRPAPKSTDPAISTTPSGSTGPQAPSSPSGTGGSGTTGTTGTTTTPQSSVTQSTGTGTTNATSGS